MKHYTGDFEPRLEGEVASCPGDCDQYLEDVVGRMKYCHFHELVPDNFQRSLQFYLALRNLLNIRSVIERHTQAASMHLQV
jgi:hypothetical protein